VSVAVDDEPAPREFVHRDDVLPGLVASAVGYRAEGMAPGLHRGLPSPYLTFILSFADAVVTGVAAGEEFRPQTANRVLLGGLHTTPAYVVQPSSQAGIQLAVHPLAARTLFGVPAAELTTAVVDGTDVLGGQIEALREQLCEQARWPERFALLSRYLRSRVEAAGGRSGSRPELTEVWTVLTRSRGAWSMDQVARHVALSPRQLRSIFTEEFGMGPKAVARLMRFQHAVGRIAEGIHNGDQPVLVDVASGCGYVDQSHLVRDFRQYTDLSPTEWI
jgi:AraC-like DNA-binding protein